MKRSNFKKKNLAEAKQAPETDYIEKMEKNLEVVKTEPIEVRLTAVVKPLEWVESLNLPKSCYTATPFGYYRIKVKRGTPMWYWEFYSSGSSVSSFCSWSIKSLEECKKSAENHWLGRMQEALED